MNTFAGIMYIDPVDCWIRNHMLGSGRMFEEDLIRTKLAPYIEKAKYIVDAGVTPFRTQRLTPTPVYGRSNPSLKRSSFSKRM